ncbi:hypothetical protein EV182_001874 [Spiromyces aspiralis]|uniref:Uncharacterized protein n=1 Tax=Spiromyces aspiralis TaxID=68401 RepID=A0ACC1I059_9FUNG|nr:hypothetical protein EV182_001874 [Spiromyces aspiralis]
MYMYAAATSKWFVSAEALGYKHPATRQLKLAGKGLISNIEHLLHHSPPGWPRPAPSSFAPGKASVGISRDQWLNAIQALKKSDEDRVKDIIRMLFTASKLLSEDLACYTKLVTTKPTQRILAPYLYQVYEDLSPATSGKVYSKLLSNSPWDQCQPSRGKDQHRHDGGGGWSPRLPSAWQNGSGASPGLSYVDGAAYLGRSRHPKRTGKAFSDNGKYSNKMLVRGLGMLDFIIEHGDHRIQDPQHIINGDTYPPRTSRPAHP